MRPLFAALLCFSAPLTAVEILPLAEVGPGLRGVGRTVFSGEAVEEFGVEILGVLENVGPRQSLIIARLEGGPLEKTGVIAGMSGSPVYVEGKLVGAVAYSFPFSTEPLCGIRPIEDMTAPAPPLGTRARAAVPDPVALLRGERLLEGTAAPPRFADGGIEPIASPISFGGFTARAIERFGDQFRALGLRPTQGVGGSARGAFTRPLEPGAMISVALIRGDLDLSAAGTVTLIDGDRLHAFGHQFLSVGPTELPMTRSRVITVVPNLESSFKLAGSGEVIGKIDLDRAAGVSGRLGEGPRMVAARVTVRAPFAERTYRLELIEDAVLTPFLFQAAVFSAVDATERAVGPQSLRVAGRVRFDGEVPDLRLDDAYVGGAGVAFQAAAGVAGPLAFLLRTAPSTPRLRDIELEIESEPVERSYRVLRVSADQREARPGETIVLSAALRGPEGEVVRKIPFRLPTSLPPGDIQVLVSDASALNMLDFPMLMNAGKLSTPDLARLVNELRRSDRLYARLWRPGRTLRVRSERLSRAPAFLKAVLDGPGGEIGGAEADAYEIIEEREAAAFDGVVSGSAALRLGVVQP